jgi:dTDP-glucose pyrophosphorylase
MKTNLNIVIPASGHGSRFSKMGYSLPKPLIEVDGNPMIKKVVDNLPKDAHFIFIVRKEHCENYNFDKYLEEICPGCDIIKVNSVTEGAAASILLAKEHINNEIPLLLANSDQYLEWDPEEFLKGCRQLNCDGVISTFTSTHPKFSYAKINGDFVTEVREKEVISDIATTGIYYWKCGSDFVKYAEDMIRKNIRFNNEFYTAPVFNGAINDNKIIKIIPCKKFWSLGTPEDLTEYLSSK